MISEFHKGMAAMFISAIKQHGLALAEFQRVEDGTHVAALCIAVPHPLTGQSIPYPVAIMNEENWNPFENLIAPGDPRFKDAEEKPLMQSDPEFLHGCGIKLP